MGDEPMPPDTWALAMSPVRMTDGRLLNWHPPQPVAFNLVEAKRYCDRASKQRRQILGNLRLRPNDAYQPANTRAVVDCLSELSIAVLCSFTAIESLANHSIDQLDDDSMVRISLRKRETIDVPKVDMVRRLNIDEKLTIVVPMLDHGRHIKGTRPWERFVHLKKLRDDLLHVKQRGYSPDPDERTAYDRLLLGDGDTCARDAFEIVRAARPDFLPDHVVEVFQP
jgi:hypothetical protein